MGKDNKNKKGNKSPVYLDLEDGSKVKVSVDNYLSDEDIAAKKLGELIRKLRKERGSPTLVQSNFLINMVDRCETVLRNTNILDYIIYLC